METLADFLVKGEPLKLSHRIYFQDALNVSQLKNESVNLIVTSPPYWNIKNYGNEEQIGFNDTYEEYLNKLMGVFSECEKKLAPKGNFCVNVGNQFIETKKSPKKMFEVMPIYEDLVHRFRKEFESMGYIGTIEWIKPSKTETSGGGSVMGSYGYPPSGLFFINKEYIFIFRKTGKRTYDPELKKYSKLKKDTLTWFTDTWNFRPAKKKSYHSAIFPYELPKRLITMFSMVGDTVLDPFLGTGTTSKAASKLGRNSIGFEIGFGKESGFDFKSAIRNKIEVDSDYITYPIENTMEKKLIHNSYYYY